MSEFTSTDVAPERLFEKHPINFSLSVLNIFADACNHTRFEFHQSQDEQQRVFLKKEGENSVIFIPKNPNLNDILSAALLISPERSLNSFSPQISKRFKDIAIWLSHNPIFENKDDLIEYFFALGSILEIKVTANNNSSYIPLTRKQIEQLKIEVPEGMNEEDYQNSLFLFLLGKNRVFRNTNKKDWRIKISGSFCSFYESLYLRWRLTKKKDKIKYYDFDFSDSRFSEISIREFDEWLISHKNFILSFLSLENPRTKKALFQTVDQTVQQLLMDKLFRKGIEYAQEKLLPPIKLSDETKRYISFLLPNFDLEKNYSTLFEMSKEILEKGKELSLWDKIKVLRDLVYEYPFKETFKISEAVKRREFECNLRSLFLAHLYDYFLRDEVVILADMIYGHMRLIVGIKDTFHTESPKFYFVDPTLNEKTKGIYNIRTIMDEKFVESILEAYNKDPYFINLLLELDTTYPFEKYHNVGNWERLIESALLTNLANITEKKPQKINIYLKSLWLNPNNFMSLSGYGLFKGDINILRKSLFLNPNNLIAILNLVSSLPSIFEDEKKIKFYRKIIDMAPYSEVASLAWCYIGDLVEDIEEKRKCYREALRINPNLDEAKFNLILSYYDKDISSLDPKTVDELIRLSRLLLYRYRYIHKEDNKELEKERKIRRRIWFNKERREIIRNFLRRLKQV